ncbi:DNA-processing protein DprA [Microbacterium dauci]|uniref:DNA-processing protein DprA n=1 Tax=Microbacterium dauci TaxID=3048008 RepID=A0ABT6ZBW5_9MICO|nr:DNA-processing protein DprA [Microbacterium sp. LX3-4]MDJ1113643.1 DNA-processing protein DprA [Microbacterium sp. LX3-4]
MNLSDLDGMRRRLIGLVPAATLDDERALRLHFAAAVWSCLTEPGDAVAGAAIAALGADEALELVLRPPTSADKAWRDGLKRWKPRIGTVDDALAAARRAGATLITPTDPSWPHSLDDLQAHVPHCLWVRGDVSALDARRPTIALVGARAATTYGEHVATDLAAGLVSAGVTVVSGGAYGIDAMAHRASVTAGGMTVAVLAGGVDRLYPAGNAALLGRVIGGAGAVVAEVPCGTTPTKWRFLQRNRLIAALATGTVVVEAGWRSGSLNTAGHAASLGRPLGAVPGPVTSAASAGCHRLLREYDARCVTSAMDARELIGLDGAVPGVGTDTRIDDRTRVLDALSARATRSVVEIARRAGLDPEQSAALVALLELEGRARRVDDGWQLAAGGARV